MIHLKTNCQSFTGSILYSDTDSQYCDEQNEDQYGKNYERIPALNSLEAIPLLGSLGGILRMALSIIHMLGHALAALCTWNRGHLPHVAKGAAEFLRGIITTIPILGTIFACSFDARNPLYIGGVLGPVNRSSCFLVSLSYEKSFRRL